MKKFSSNFLLIVIFLMGLFLRFHQLSSLPVGINPDETSQGYTAYSILKTGRDEWGEFLPIMPRSFGEYKMPLQIYLMIPFVYIFGLNEFSVRAPNALLSSLAIVGAYLLAKKLFKKESIGLLSSLMLAVSPWFLPLSRGAFEANLTVFFISFGIYFFIKGLETKNFFDQLLAAVLLGLNLFSYISARIMTPIFITIIFLNFNSFSDKKAANSVLRLRIFSLFFSFFLFVALLTSFWGGQTRSNDVAIFNPTDNWQEVSDQRWQAVTERKIPDFWARFFHNKLVFSVKRISANYLTFISPQFFFSEGPSESTYGMIPGQGVLWWWELPVILFGLYQLVKKKNRTVFLLILFILLAPIPAAMAKGARAANRAAVMMPWIQIFVSWSLYQLFFSLKKKPFLSGKVLNFLFFGIFLFFLTFFLENYFVQSPFKTAEGMLFGRCLALEKAVSLAKRNSPIVISRKLSEPQTFVTFCLSYPPEQVQQSSPSWLEYQERGLSFLDQLGEYSLGNFIFKEINWASDSLIKGAVLVGLPEEFPASVDDLIRIDFPNKDPAIIIYANQDKQ